MSFKTERLVVQHWAEHLKNPALRKKLAADLQPVLTSVVLRHLPDPLHISNAPHAIHDWMSAREDESTVLTVRHAADHALLGLVILADMPGDGGQTEVHLGYLLAETAWGIGYATEIISGLIGWYKKEKPDVTLIGGVEKDNPASARVLEKCGFRVAPNLSSDTADMYCLTL